MPGRAGFYEWSGLRCKEIWVDGRKWRSPDEDLRRPRSRRQPPRPTRGVQLRVDLDLLSEVAHRLLRYLRRVLREPTFDLEEFGALVRNVSPAAK